MHRKANKQETADRDGAGKTQQNGHNRYITLSTRMHMVMNVIVDLFSDAVAKPNPHEKQWRSYHTSYGALYLS